METKKLSRTVRRRLNKQGILTSSATTKLPEESSTAKPKHRSKKKTKKIKTQSETEHKLTVALTVTETVDGEKKKKKKKKSSKTKKNPTKVTPTVADASKPKNSTTMANPILSSGNRKRKRDNRVVYINSNYGGGDPNSVGGIIQAELVELRKQSANIKSASDLTETQAHVIKRQITRLHGGDEAIDYKRPKHYDQTVEAATKELMKLMAGKSANKR